MQFVMTTMMTRMKRETEQVGPAPSFWPGRSQMPS